MEQTYRQMAAKLEKMDRLTREIRDLGQGLPVIERNTTALAALLRALKFGVKDTAAALAARSDQTKA